MFDEADQSLELRRIGREFRYDASGFQGVSLRRVAIDRAGLYRINASAPAGAFAISVGRGDTPSTSSTDQAAWLVGIIGGAIGVIGLLTTGVLRSRARARAAGALPGQAPVSGPDPSPARRSSRGCARGGGGGSLAVRPGRSHDRGARRPPRRPSSSLSRTTTRSLPPSSLAGEPDEAPSAFSATAPLPPVERTPEPAGSAPPPPPPPPPPAATPVPPGPAGAGAAPGWGPPATGTAADPFEIREVPPPPPPPPES